VVINTGARTDTVNYYGDWLLKRLDEGFVYARNPLFPNKVTRYRLDPSVVDCLVFCSKNFTPILGHMGDIAKKFNIFCHYTITAYGKDIEPNVPGIDEGIETLIALSRIVGKEKIAWRYDPVLLTGRYTIEKHLETFDYMAGKIAPFAGFCIFSFVEMYKHIEMSMPELIPLKSEDKQKLAAGLGALAKKHGLLIQTCGTDDDYSRYGVMLRGCMTPEILGTANNITFKKMTCKGLRKGCHCMPSRDIGAYNTCLNGCKYCYANKKPELCRENYKLHNKDSPILIGHLKPTDIISDGSQKSFLEKDLLL
jgi:hypothetical protein